MNVLCSENMHNKYNVFCKQILRYTLFFQMLMDLFIKRINKN